MAYRYWCGECSFKTPWGTESQGRQRQIDHYRRQHPGIPPGGQVETSTRNQASGQGCLGCLALAVVLILLLFLAAACGH